VERAGFGPLFSVSEIMSKDARMALPDITRRIAAAEAAAGRPAGSVRLIAVSKLQPGERVLAVLQAGQQIFGENYVQEAAAKWPAWRLQFPEVEVHMIGPLQTNKAKQAVELFEAIHTLDRPSLAEKLARLAQARGQGPALFVQVNTGAEPQKAGILPEALDGFIRDCRALDLAPQGLMCIPPEGEDPRPHFAALAEMAARNGLSGLSMGMSSDFEAAIALGATHIRVGSAIFGARTV
jgi:pyridoxal phosphate enzyme (YggS family)